MTFYYKTLFCFSLFTLTCSSFGMEKQSLTTNNDDIEWGHVDGDVEENPLSDDQKFNTSWNWATQNAEPKPYDHSRSINITHYKTCCKSVATFCLTIIQCPLYSLRDCCESFGDCCQSFCNTMCSEEPICLGSEDDSN